MQELQSILQDREEELDSTKKRSDSVDKEKLKYFEARLQEMEKERNALSSTLQSKQNKID